MSRRSRLQGVAHDTMDHAVSGLSCLFPHVTDFLAASGERQLHLNLLSSEPAVDDRLPGPLRRAAQACRKKFADILVHSGLELSDVDVSYLDFEALDQTGFTCQCTLQSASGKRYVASMNSKTYWSSNREDPLDALRKLRHGG